MLLPILLSKTKLLPIYVVGLGEHERQRHIIRPYGFHSYQILYCTSGSGILKFKDEEHRINPGDAFFFRPDIPHEYYPLEAPWSVRFIVFTGSAAPDIFDYLGLGDIEPFRLHNLDDFHMQVTALFDMFRCDDPDKEIKTSMLLYKLLIKVGEYRNNLPQPSGISKNERYEKLNPVIEMLKTRYAEDLSLDDMASVIGVTTNHLCRLFHLVYGTTPLKYLTHLRLNMAKHYLCAPENKKVKDIAALVGFKDPSYFCSVFKKAEGMTPDVFRRNNAF